MLNAAEAEDHSPDAVDESVDSINEEFDATSIDDQREVNDVDDEELDEGLQAQEEVDRQRMEKCFRRQEEAWLTKREKVGKIKMFYIEGFMLHLV